VTDTQCLPGGWSVGTWCQHVAALADTWCDLSVRTVARPGRAGGILHLCHPSGSALIARHSQRRHDTCNVCCG